VGLGAAEEVAIEDDGELDMNVEGVADSGAGFCKVVALGAGAGSGTTNGVVDEYLVSCRPCTALQ